VNALALMLTAAATAQRAVGNRFPNDESLDLAYLYASSGHTGLAMKLAEQALRNAQPLDVQAVTA
jgi:hypothetical protein